VTVNGSAGHHPERRGKHPLERILCWWIAPLDSTLKGLSLTRLLAIGIFYATVHLAHDWIEHTKITGVALGWAFSSFIILGFTLAVCTALGGKAVMAFVAAKLSGTTLAPVEGK
jgi:hypothetical protein